MVAKHILFVRWLNCIGISFEIASLMVVMTPGLCHGEIRITDDANRTVVFENVPERIVSIAPSNTEILFALGLGDKVVGVTTQCLYPEEAARKEKIGDFTAVNLEKIVLLGPDCIFATGLEQMMNVERLDKLGFKVVVISPSDVSHTLRSIELIGRITGKEDQAKKLIKTMEERIVKVSERIEPVPLDKRPKVLVGISLTPLITAGSDSLVNDLIRLAGGRNIAYDAARSYAQFSIEKFIERNPDVIVLGYSDTTDRIWKEFFKRDEFKDLTCVKEGRIYNVNPDIIFRPSPRLVEGIEKLHELFYPGDK